MLVLEVYNLVLFETKYVCVQSVQASGYKKQNLGRGGGIFSSTQQPLDHLSVPEFPLPYPLNRPLPIYILPPTPLLPNMSYDPNQKDLEIKIFPFITKSSSHKNLSFIRFLSFSFTSFYETFLLPPPLSKYENIIFSRPCPSPSPSLPILNSMRSCRMILNHFRKCAKYPWISLLLLRAAPNAHRKSHG